MIFFDNKLQTFFLESKALSYIFKLERGRLKHIYFGKKLPREDLDSLNIYYPKSFCPVLEDYELKDRKFSLESRMSEFPQFNNGDFRIAQLVVEYGEGCTTDFKYVSHSIQKDKPSIKGMPSLRNGETLVVEMLDDVTGLVVKLFYTIYDEGAIARRAELFNGGKERILLKKFGSGGLDLDGADYEVVQLSGRHCFERMIERVPLTQSIHTLSSIRGTSSHQNNPFLAIVKKETTEEFGEAIGFNLIYSGSFLIEAETDQWKTTRILAGLHPLCFQTSLNTGESFETPEVVIVYSNEGLGKMSRSFHDLYRNHLINPKFSNPRPIVLNTWEGCYFDFDEKKLFDIIDNCKGLGIDTVVLDDGWFGHRNDDTSSLGDWFVFSKKLPNGLEAIANRCKQNNLKFGLWFEPEMISEDSELYKKHPDFCLHTVNRSKSKGREQLVLDFSKKEVVDNVFEQMDAIFSRIDISYVKWDMNRHLTEVPRFETFHKYVLGVYSLYERISKKYPNIIIEGCSGGGGRFDAGILYYSPYIWTSDNTDAYSRGFIQYGTSLCYPLAAMSNHISNCPNHQTSRTTPLKTRAAIAMLGSLGFEFDPVTLNMEERNQIKEQIGDYKKIRDLALEGDLYRLVSPFESEDFCFQIVSKDKKRALIVLMQAHAGIFWTGKIKPQGLDEDYFYTITRNNEKLENSFSGKTLTNFGIQYDSPEGDYGVIVIMLEASGKDNMSF